MAYRSFATAITVIGWVGFMVLFGASNAQSEEVCAGDCDGDLVVTVDELVLGVRIGLGERGVEACQTLDLNGDERVTIEELVRAISFALDGCFPVPTTPPPTATQTPTPTLTPCSPPRAPEVNGLAAQVGDLVMTVTGSVLIERDGTYVYLCAETGCVSTGSFTGAGQHSLSLAMLLRRDRVNHLFICTQDRACGGTACTEMDAQGAPLTVQQVPCLSASCTPTPSPTPTCGSIVYEFCDGGHRGGTCGPCCFCEATVSPAPMVSPTTTPTPSVTPTPPVCASPGCPDLQPAAAQEFLPRPEGSCITDVTEILPYFVNVCIGNSGGSAAGPFRVETTAPPNFDDPFSPPVFEVPSLDAGAQLCRLVLHPYYVLQVAVDSANQVIESDESNNRQSYPLAIPTAPPFCTVTPTPLSGPLNTGQS